MCGGRRLWGGGLLVCCFFVGDVFVLPYFSLPGLCPGRGGGSGPGEFGRKEGCSFHGGEKESRGEKKSYHVDGPPFVNLCKTY